MHIAVIDAETDPFKFGRIPSPFIWGFYDGGNYEYFDGVECTNDLIEYLSQLDGEWCVYAHNGGKFDFYFFLDHIMEDIKLINGRISQATLKYNVNIKFRDSFNILPIPLSAYAKDDIDYSRMEPDVRHKHAEEIEKYLYKDCIYLYDLVSKFNDIYGNKLTIAGTAFAELKKTGYLIPKTFDSFDITFRHYYFGGRVQCFKTGHFVGDYKYIDICSAYPYAMLDEHPRSGEYHSSRKLPDSGGGWFAEITAISNGVLPMRAKDNSLYFPVDLVERVYHATGWEIYAGLDTGSLDIKVIHTVQIFDELSDFKDYILPLYAARKIAKDIGDKIGDIFNKLLMNSCYGKFGQDGRKFESYKIFDFGDKPDGDEWTVYADLETGQRIYSSPSPSNGFYNVATAASITGYVRAYLWRAICDSEGVMYCDTDSIICESTDALIGGELGEWEIEAEFDELNIAQKKMYACRTKNGVWKTASKGVKLSAEQIRDGVINKRNITVERPAPAFSLKYGPRFFDRTVNFSGDELKRKKTPKYIKDACKKSGLILSLICDLKKITFYGVLITLKRDK